MTDINELIANVKKRKRSSQKGLFDRYAPLMRAICMRYARSFEEAEDIVQEGFIKIFNPFFQGNLFNSMVGKGAGIGLAYTKELVQIHHGEINAASNPWKGTVFTVKIPIDYACYG